ncbi:MAG: hypothetical protein RIR10_151 [Planctomycetota bacterium]|jgi:hypothetical protein
MSNLILAIPDWLIMPVLSASMPLAAIALVFLGIGLGGRREGLEIRCRRCRHQYVFGQPVPAACSECGASTTAKRALAVGVWQPRWGALIFAIAGIVFVPAMYSFARLLPDLKAEALRSGGIDVAIDAAMKNPQHMELERLHEALQAPSETGTDVAWLRFAERIEREPEVQALAVAYLEHAVSWGRSTSTNSAASDDAFEKFGRALAAALRANPALTASFPRVVGGFDGLPPILFEPIIADPEAMRAFLRGPVIAVKHVPRRYRDETQIALVEEGVELLRRKFALESAAVSYGRRDGTSVQMEPLVPTIEGRSRPYELDATFGTDIPLRAPLADAEWDGTLRIEARVGHVSAGRLGRRTTPIEPGTLEGVVDHTWEIRVERVDPTKLRAIPATDPNASEMVRASLEPLMVNIVANADGVPSATCTLENFGTVNGLVVALSASIEQEERTWPVARSAQNRALGNQPTLLDGFEIGRPYTLVLEGVAPESAGRLEDFTYLAGRWIAKYDGTRRTPTQVTYTVDPNVKVKQSPIIEDGMQSRQGRVVQGATVGPKRPIAEAPAAAKP